MSWGGKREGSGRKSKADELKLIENLTPYQTSAYEKLGELINKGNIKAIELWFKYYHGPPPQIQDITLNQDTPLFEVVVKNNESRTD
jgi:hypothetical protein